jgi:GH35 family endo-1,4-beta-xylanase
MGVFRWRLVPLVGSILLLTYAVSTLSYQRTDIRQIKTGISYGDRLVRMSDAELDSALHTATYVGANLVRADLSWNDIQQRRSDGYSWHLFDRLVNAARRHRLTVLPVLTDTPAWARLPGCPSAHCEPRDPAAFAAFAQAAARRYAPLGVHSWEIWNEPNTSRFWAPVSDPVAYTALLKATATALKKVDPRALAVSGGLANANTGGGNIAQTEFLAKMSMMGGNRVIDGIGYHPYTYPLLPSSVTKSGTAWEKIDKTRVSLRSVLVEFGTPRLPVWVTEVGAPTGGPGQAADGSPATTRSTTTHVTEALQARIAASTVRTAAKDRSIAVLIWYTDADSRHAGGAATTEDFYGLCRANGTAKPALDALRWAISGQRS